MLAYQSGTVSRMLLNYFNTPAEVNAEGPYAMPRPDKVICNGPMPYDYLRGSGWPRERLSVAEATRYSHLNACMGRGRQSKKDAVLLAFSINHEESGALLRMAYEAFKDTPDIEVWLRPHPYSRLERVLELAAIGPVSPPFKVKKGRIADILSEARVVVAGESGVSLEAVACGCGLILADTPEWINMSPLKGIDAGLIKKVDSPEGLREAVSEIFRQGDDPDGRMAQARRIIDNFFCLDRRTDEPKNFLKILVGADG